MKKLYYITRTNPNQLEGGGGIIRNGAVKHLQQTFDVDVITIGLDQFRHHTDNKFSTIEIPYVGQYKIERFKQALGMNQDYMEKWAKTAFDYLKDKITKKDILFATTGGELGSIILAAMLKRYSGAKFVINFHDPILFTSLFHEGISRYPHIRRDKIEKKYIGEADLIVTSSQYHKEKLIEHYGVISSKIQTNYFGYVNEKTYKSHTLKLPLIIAYAGAFGSFQTPEILAQAVAGAYHAEDVRAVFIGYHRDYEKLNKYKDVDNISFIEPMEYEKCMEYVSKEAGAGFVSLSTDALGMCVPSKIYDYINLGIPILGALPNGDAKHIINSNKFGVAVDYDNINEIRKGIDTLMQSENYQLYVDNIKKKRWNWSMFCKSEELTDMLLGILA